MLSPTNSDLSPLYNRYSCYHKRPLHRRAIRRSERPVHQSLLRTASSLAGIQNTAGTSQIVARLWTNYQDADQSLRRACARRPAVHSEKFLNTRFPAQNVAAQLICPCMGAFGYKRNNTQAYRPGAPIWSEKLPLKRKSAQPIGARGTKRTALGYVTHNVICPQDCQKLDIEAHIFACCHPVGGCAIET